MNSPEPAPCRASDFRSEVPSGKKFDLRYRHRTWIDNQKLVALSFSGDAVVVFFSLFVSYLVRFETSLSEVGVADASLTLQSYVGHIAIGGVVMLALLANFRFHDPRMFLAFRSSVKVLVRSCALWCGVFLALALMLKIDPTISRLYCLIAAVVSMAALLGWRWIFYCLVRSGPMGDGLRQKTIFIGWNDDSEAALSPSLGGRGLQHRVVGVVRPQDGVFEKEPPSEVRILGDFTSLREIVRQEEADIVMAVEGATDRRGMLDIVEVCGREFVDFKLVPNCFQVLLSGLRLESVNGMPVLGVGRLPLHYLLNNIMKRALDIVGALLGLFFFGPVIVLFAGMVWLESRGAVIYRQRRIGLNGRPFEILKIRSMKLDAELDGSVGWTVQDDPRCLNVGAFMRKWNIDELPQFWNVLRGQMSLVGPRPERPELINGFKEEIPHYNLRHNIKPGVTGWAQVNGLRGDTCLEKRVSFDLHYMENWNFFLDFQIMALTFFKRKGAC